MNTTIEFGYNTPIVDIDLATGLCQLQYNEKSVIIPNEVWRTDGCKILTWFDNLYNGGVTYIKHNIGQTVTIVLPFPIQDKINVEEFLVWVKLSSA